MSGSSTARKRDLSGAVEFWSELIGRFDIVPHISYFTTNERLVRILTDEDVIETLKKYNQNAVGGVASVLYDFARGSRSRKKVVNLSKIVGLRKVVDTANSSYAHSYASDISRNLARVARDLNDKNAVIEMAKTLWKYRYGNEQYIASNLSDASTHLKDPRDFIRLNRLLRRYTDGTATDMAGALSAVFDSLPRDSLAPRLIEVFKRIGKRMFDAMDPDEMLEMMKKGMDKLVEDRETFDVVAAYLESENDLPKPSRENIRDYPRAVSDYTKKKYKIRKDIGADELVVLLAVIRGRDKDDLRKVVKFVNSSEERNVKHYSIGMKDADSLNYSKDMLTQYSIISIVGSKDKEKEKRAVDAISSIVGQKTVNRARNEFRSRHKHLLKDIVGAFHQSDYSRVRLILERTNSNDVMSVLDAACYMNGNAGKNEIIRAVESKNPLDYDKGVQIACVYLPQSMDVLDYCRDRRFVLVRYDIGDETLGSAICYVSGKKFLVDSVEGHRRFRKDKIYDIVLKDLVKRAKERNAELVVFNRNVANVTAKGFVRHLGRKSLAKRELYMRVSTEGYIESRSSCTGNYDANVDAYVVHL